MINVRDSMDLKLSGQLVEKFLRVEPLEELNHLIKFQVRFLEYSLCHVVSVLNDEV